MSDSLSPDLVNWAQQFTGVNLGADGDEQQDPAADQAQPVSDVTAAPAAAPAPGQGATDLAMPPVGMPAADQAGLPAGQQLHFQLSPDELAACNRYLDAHFDAVLTQGSSPALQDSYQPGLDGKPVQTADVVHVLLPLTTAAMSKDGSDQIHKDFFSQLYEIAQSRLTNLALSKSKAAMDAATSKATGDVAAASLEVDTWLKNYLQGNGLAVDPRDDGSTKVVIFGNKSTPIATVVGTAVAAGGLANLQSGEQGRSLITADRVLRIIKDLLTPAGAAVPSKPDDGPEVSVEVDPTKGTAETQIQYTVSLKATNDDSPPKVQILPDVDITVHIGPDGKSPSIETQLNAVKADIGRLLHIGGKIKIQATVGLSAEVDVNDAALGKIAKALEVTLKAELEISITKNLAIKPNMEQGPDGKVEGGFGVVWKF